MVSKVGVCSVIGTFPGYTHFRFLSIGGFFWINWASTRETLSSGVCEQPRRRPACATVQSDQLLCYSLARKYHAYLTLLQVKFQFSS